MRFRTEASPHVPSRNDTGALMREVLYALLPALAVAWWFFGWGILINVVLASAAALAGEAAMLTARGRPVGPALADGSALLTAALLGLAVPALAPWWLVVVGSLFAIVFAKHLYGGLGYNPFNPAMIGYVVLLISFPLEMTTWPAARGVAAQHLDLLGSLHLAFGGMPAKSLLDAVSGATPLDAVKTGLGLKQTVAQTRAGSLFGEFGGKGWEWLSSAYLLGGLWLLYRRVIAWQIPAGMLGALVLLSGLFWLVNPSHYPPPTFELFSGAALVGAFFIATDPITASTTPRGRLLFGAGIGILAYTIRTWGGYPDGVAFGVLLMNMVAPTLDYLTRPRVFGADRS